MRQSAQVRNNPGQSWDPSEGHMEEAQGTGGDMAGEAPTTATLHSLQVLRL